jgi:Protein of unknown function (DUF2723)
MNIKKLFKTVIGHALLIPLLLFIGTFLIYTRNLSPSVYGGDAGDFLSAAITKGVSHPSGYPLYTMLGELALLLPLTKSPAWKMGLVSVVLSSFSVVTFYFISKRLTKDKIVAFISSLTLAFTYTFWLYSEFTEVFALHVLLMLALIYFTIVYMEEKSTKVLYLLALLAGLSLTNNLSIVLILLPIGILILIANYKILIKIRLLIKLFLMFLMGLTPYLYIPIAAAKNPYMNWGNAINFKNFIALVFRLEYGWGSGLKYQTDYVLTQLTTYATYLTTYISPLTVFFASLGVIFLILKKKYKLLFLFLGLFVLTGPFYIIYSKAPILILGDFAAVEKFYLPSVVSLTLLYPFGIVLISKVSTKLLRKPSLKLFIKQVIYFVITLITVTFFIINEGKTNLSDCYIGDYLGKDILQSVPENSILLLSDDAMDFNSIYIQQAFKLRKDVDIVGKHNTFQVLFEDPSQKKGVYYQIDPSSINNKMLLPLIANAMLTRPVFSAEKLEFKVGQKELKSIVAIPHGLLFKLVFEDQNLQKEEDYLNEVNTVLTRYHYDDLNYNSYLVNNSFVLSHIRRIYAFAYINTSKYLFNRYGDKERSAEFAKKAFKIDPLLRDISSD